MRAACPSAGDLLVVQELVKELLRTALAFHMGTVSLLRLVYDRRLRVDLLI